MTETASASSGLEGKKIIFSGGSGYLGAVMAEHLLKCGASLANIGRRAPDFLSKFPRQASHYKVDFYESEDLTDVLGQAIEGLGGVDVLVNNSFDFSPRTGFNDPSGRVENISKETFMKGLESGIYWPLHCTQVVGKQMIEQKYGNIINIASLYSSLVADYRMYEGRDIFNPVTYPVSKHGLVGLTKYIASFWAPHGIRCNCLSPGSFPNTISQKDDPSAPNSVDDDAFLEILNRKCSLGRTGVPKDLESAIQFLCSEKSSYLTGVDLAVDGGWSVL
jgi:gluconate 5-dehydrogenase